MGKYIVYFDSGTSNSRIYLLDKDFQVLYVDKKNVGSRNSSIEGSNRVLIEGMFCNRLTLSDNWYMILTNKIFYL